MNNEYTKIHEIQTEITVLMNKLSSNSSDIGDWRINKIYEYRMQGNVDPNDFEQLCNERQAVRDRINVLQEELASIEAGE